MMFMNLPKEIIHVCDETASYGIQFIQVLISTVISSTLRMINKIKNKYMMTNKNKNERKVSNIPMQLIILLYSKL